MWRFLGRVILCLAGLGALGAALLFYFVYAPPPQQPHLGGRLTRASLAVGGLTRSYLLYVPKGLPKGAALVMALHGSDGSGARMRLETGYGFERLADAHGFAVVYPDGYEGYWNGCNIVGDYAANARNIDDVGFLEALGDKLAREIGVDRGKVFAVGLSRGGHMAYRLALEAPERFRAVAAVAASLPAPENFKCKPRGRSAPPVMIMNGTDDPLNPFDGGEVTLFGFLKRGTVLSSRATAQYFARAHGKVELVAIHGGGHVMPQPYWRAPRILGPTPAAPDGPAAIWDFFARSM
ncbi:MAG: polyhydroxybutyrate depolymerase [Alphaproteobacteria bacterium]|nr:polyhydroxybutyrate depolymerase [Alphaproteobacteria bacterium]